MLQKAAFVWEGGQHGGGPGGSGKCGGAPGGQGQGNLVHWMSVMAEHMNNVTTNHHDGIHYMAAWNSGVDVSSPLTTLSNNIDKYYERKTKFILSCFEEGSLVEQSIT